MTTYRFAEGDKLCAAPYTLGDLAMQGAHLV
jgi:hypothetical protein